MMTGTFKDQPWAQRFKKLGDEAEQIFESWAAIQGIGFHRSGLDRPPFQVGKLPTLIAYTPDYLTADCYIEVQGFGRAQEIKLKEDKLQALWSWDRMHCTKLFLWDNANRRTALLPIKWFLLNKPTREGAYPEGKPYTCWDANQVDTWEPYGLAE